MPALVVAIYRQRNAARLARLLARAASPDTRYALWALDAPSAVLAERTVGQGSGGKFDLVNAVLDRTPARPEEHLVVTDDDIDLGGGSLSRLCAVMDSAGLGLAQPAHGRRSRSSYEFNRRRLGSRARLTSFVEIGPVFAVQPEWLPAVVPFPPDIGMGWGLELIWARLQERGCRLGVVDAVTVVHHESPTIGYAQEAEEARAQALMAQSGIRYMREAQHVLGTWWCWQSRPPWMR